MTVRRPLDERPGTRRGEGFDDRGETGVETARFASSIAATLTTGLVSGLFHGFSVAVTPSLRRTGDRTVAEDLR
ncbi:hypothetical protein [Streptomyces subrutilus]|uniref:Uncharacterized protein n=1 Tax=Streptomyces subrutilus TaxID=36818 RepID=A0A1E5P046_9ACTN|nr:hypothetical protein [Streptomyces subrutilus]OEJ22430.1 hypothetical protein BGK67_33350 [Streptomyces subrutilus]